MTGQPRREALLWELRGKAGKQTVEVPALPPGPVLVEACPAEDKAFSVKGPGLHGSFGRLPSNPDRGERELWCTAGEATSLKVKAKTPWLLRFHGPAAATVLVDTVSGIGTDVLAYEGPATDGQLRSHPHPDRFLNQIIDDGMGADIAFVLPLDASRPDQRDFTDFRHRKNPETDFTLSHPCLIQVSAVTWCQWTATLDTITR